MHYSDCDPPQCSAAEWRTARKPHRCIECGGTVKPGERYRVTSGVEEGRPFRYADCARCCRIEAAHFAGQIAIDETPGYIIASLAEQVGETAREEPAYRWAFRKAWRMDGAAASGKEPR